MAWLLLLIWFGISRLIIKLLIVLITATTLNPNLLLFYHFSRQPVDSRMIYYNSKQWYYNGQIEKLKALAAQIMQKLPFAEQTTILHDEITRQLEWVVKQGIPQKFCIKAFDFEFTDNPKLGTHTGSYDLSPTKGLLYFSDKEKYDNYLKKNKKAYPLTSLAIRRFWGGSKITTGIVTESTLTETAPQTKLIPFHIVEGARKWGILDPNLSPEFIKHVNEVGEFYDNFALVIETLFPEEPINILPY